jgi:hypothetical protein
MAKPLNLRTNNPDNSRVEHQRSNQRTIDENDINPLGERVTHEKPPVSKWRKEGFSADPLKLHFA